MIDTADLHTETFTNREGWTVVRVTHLPTGDIAERERTKELASSVQAQAECIDELGTRVRRDDATVLGFSRRESTEPVTRAELDALTARVATLESALRDLAQRAGRAPT